MTRRGRRWFDRRGFIRLGAAAVLCSFSQPLSKAQSTGSFAVEDVSVARVDHLILGVSDLQAGIRAVEKQTGVRPVRGGRHPGGGTRNALISLGERHYLEILAPDPDQEPGDRSRELKALRAPKLIGCGLPVTPSRVLQPVPERGPTAVC